MKVIMFILAAFFLLPFLGGLFIGHVWLMGLVLGIIFLVIGYSINVKNKNDNHFS